MKRRTIGTLAREAGVNVETVRFHERCGILAQPPEPPKGWREYGKEGLDLIRYIKQAQQMGFTLAELSVCKSRRMVTSGRSASLFGTRLAKRCVPSRNRSDNYRLSGRTWKVF
jgi:hypothetical protein